MPLKYQIIEYWQFEVRKDNLYQNLKKIEL